MDVHVLLPMPWTVCICLYPMAARLAVVEAAVIDMFRELSLDMRAYSHSAYCVCLAGMYRKILTLRTAV